MKKALIGIGILSAVIFAGLIYVWSNLDSIVQQAIETHGSQAVKTDVKVAKVHLELENGTASIGGLTIANPAGFKDANIFELGNISIKVDTSSLSENPIIIDEIIINSPVVAYEINKSGTSNADILKKNLGIKSSSDNSVSQDDDELKMIIRKLVVEGSQAKVRIAALGDRVQSVKLPRIQLTDIGKKSNGASGAEVAQLLSSKLLGNVKSSVGKLGVDKYLGKSADLFKKGGSGAVDSIGDAAGEATDTLKGMFGK